MNPRSSEKVPWSLTFRFFFRFGAFFLLSKQVVVQAPSGAARAPLCCTHNTLPCTLLQPCSGSPVEFCALGAS